MWFSPFQSHRTAPPLVSNWSMDYPVESADGFLLSITSDYGRCGVGLMHTLCYSHRVPPYLSKEEKLSTDSGSQKTKKQLNIKYVSVKLGQGNK